jgi:hypothetical protein
MKLVADIIVSENKSVDTISHEVLDKSREKTSKREFSEVTLRLRSLDAKEIEYLAHGSLQLSKQVALLACIRSYGFIKDFIEDVILEKVSLYDFSLTERDYNSFVRNKEIDHPELEEIADSTKYKIKQVLFRILDQSDMIDSIKEKQINHNYLESSLATYLGSMGKHNEIKLLLG